MAVSEVEELLVHEVDVGVANMDFSTGDGVVSAQVVVERAKGRESSSGEEREVLLVYGADAAPALADAIRNAADRAATAP
jgi:hypothetical protein